MNQEINITIRVRFEFEVTQRGEIENLKVMSGAVETKDTLQEMAQASQEANSKLSYGNANQIRAKQIEIIKSMSYDRGLSIPDDIELWLANEGAEYISNLGMRRKDGQPPKVPASVLKRREKGRSGEYEGGEFADAFDAQDAI